MKRPLYTRKTKAVALITLFTHCFMLFAPQIGSAQTTSGTSSETMGPSGQTTQMVDLFTGDFNYSIPLMNVDGFPITLNYNGNVSMHQEASWVGLGWSLNTGAINREMRGIPDDFNGDLITSTESIKADKTKMKNFGVTGSITPIPGIINPLRIGWGTELKGGPISNSYQGKGGNFDLLFNFTASTAYTGANGAVQGSLGINVNSLRGIGWHHSISLGMRGNINNNDYLGWGITVGYTSANSTRGARSKYQHAKITAGPYSIAGGSDVSYGSKTFIPEISRSGIGSGSMFRVEAGYYGPVSPVPNPTITAYGIFETGNNDHNYVSNTITKRAFGYFNLQNGANISNAITDFNRENWDKISREISVLPVAHVTHDIFRMATPFHSASFRAHRNDVGCTNNYVTTENNSSTSNALEAGAGGVFRVRYTNSIMSVTGESKNWLESGSASSALKHRNVRGHNDTCETYYFKSTGEPVKYNSTFFDQYGGTNVAAINISRTGSDFDNLPTLRKYNNYGQLVGTSSLPGTNFIIGKEPRNTLYATLSAELASKSAVGFEDSLVSYGLNTYGSGVNSSETKMARVTSKKKSHHLSEIIATSPNGERSVFNYPVYSLKEKEVYFNVSSHLATANSQKKLIEYTEGTDNSTSNTNGYEHLFHSNEIPGYASSFLLRGILSPDYSDRTGDGMTEDDYGSYVKLNYTQIYSESNPFKWRAPISEGDPTASGYPLAVHLENVKSYDDDEMGYYNYGEKELWYTHSIEGKNYIAVFYLGNRDDMFSVVDENGKLDQTKPGKLLSKIVLFSKEDLETNGANAQPLQTVKFVYDYSLCQEFDGNKNKTASDTTSGKLTLKSVYIITSDSKKGSRTAYSFDYDNNPDYHIGKADRWGSYDTDVTGNLNNFDFPYAEQDRTTADANASAWALTDITLPTGGKIEITYEADDYAYVENRRAMQMLPIKNLSRNIYIGSASGHVSSHLIRDGGTSYPEKKKKSNNTLYIDLPEAVTVSGWTAGKQKFYELYLKDIHEKYNDQIYFKCLVEMTYGEGNYEWVEGYAKVTDYGLVDDSYGSNYAIPTSTGYIVLEDIEVDWDNGHGPQHYGVNPILHKAFQDIRLDKNRILYPDGNPSVNGLDVSVMLNGINKGLHNKKFCRRLNLNNSFVRLIDPYMNKIGGGSRVQKIIYKDAWNAMANENEFSYGEVYEYLNDDGTSSGVAGYEPTTGNDENPFRQPVRYNLSHDKYPYDKLYHQTPFGEMAFQSPIVGYSRVKVKNIERSNVTRNATGHRLYEFYTAKDYPTRNIKSPLEKLSLKSDPGYLDYLLGNPEYDLVGLSQGFIIQKNDMHGKTKSVKSFSESGMEISSTEYSYKIGENINLVEQDGDVISSVVARDVDIIADAFTTVFATTNESVGGFVSLTGIFPVVAPGVGVISSGAYKEEGFFMTTFNKVIHDYAVLDKVITRHLGAETTAQNLAYDEKTGQVLVSSVQNQYDKPVYSVSYPTWWYEDAFKPASEIYGNHEELIDIISGGSFTSADASLYSLGDVVYVKNGTSYSRYTVFDIDTGTDAVILIDDDGSFASTATDVDIVVIKPGRKNIPFMTMMEYTTLDNPLSGSTLENPTDGNVLSASAVEYSECWQAYSNNLANCTTTPAPTCGLVTGENFNPYKTGVRGNWRVKKGFVYQINRNEELTASTVDLRTAGTYKSFAPYYEDNTGWIDINQIGHSGYANRANWINTGTIVRYDDNGNPIETKDILGNYSSVLFGYNNNLRVAPVAAATNAQLKQIAYDGFEDYAFRDDVVGGSFCRLPGHFDFIENSGASKVTTTEAHSGKYSLKLQEDDTIRCRRTIKAYAESTCSRKSDVGFEGTDQLPLFAPDVNSSQPYVISVWTKQAISIDDPVDAYHDPVIIVRQYNSSGTAFKSDYFGCDETPIIEGWQKISGEFIITDSTACISVVLKHTGTNSADVYFDDLRIHPFNASMGTISYDPLTLRKLSQGDDYNFTTFFQYDENGFMTRILQETIKGIVTLTETRSGLNK